MSGVARNTSFVLALLVVAACEEKHRGDDPATLRSCVADVWQSRLSLACTTACGGQSPAPECAAADCEFREFLWLRADGMAAEGFFLASEEIASFSSAGAPATSTYSIDDDSLAIQRDVTEEDDVACDDDELVWGSERLARAPSGADASFAAAFTEGGWRGAPYLQ